MSNHWNANGEPTLAEVFEEPAIRTLMDRDHVTRDDLRRHIEAVRANLRARRIAASGGGHPDVAACVGGAV